uniref:LOW QUALITY PROTEIN: putative F-box/FBD/LRR-repeat protein At5g22670 n=1 Tax=Fragaria vesca subsp. vesca TaxID=101020 RepID=UPI0005CA81A9|nr:PREDICTED: LOW QUALITY PROTEIN: putative F-box/FBD/LRR-repeat protein At5g22670 [Fragaria vesca subsp. vesca]
MTLWLPIPWHWQCLIDPFTGWLYFWNPVTNVTQYERPSPPLYHHQFYLQQYLYPWLPPPYHWSQLIQYSNQYPAPSIPTAVQAPHWITIPFSYPRHQSFIQEGEDRISELPDDLICHILSFLPTLSAVRTTLLSKRWNEMWTFVRHLDFDIYRDKFRYESHFTSFVQSILLRRSSLDIEKIRFRYANSPDESSYLNDLVSAAVSCNVIELDLQIHGPCWYVVDLPRSIFRCKTLKVLKLCIDQDIDIPEPPTSGCFPSLKIFHLTVVDPHETLGRLLSYIPVLEDLSIHVEVKYSHIFYDNINVKVSAPELKTLKLSMEWEDYFDYDEITKQYHFCVDAPKLENLEVIQIPLSNYILENPKSVVNASIAFEFLAEEEWPPFPAMRIRFWLQYPMLKCLSLSDQPFEASKIPIFGSLNQLRLVLCNHNSSWEFLTELLQKTPNLEDLDLVLENVWEDEDYPELQWNPLQLVPDCLSSNLKTISIRGFKGRQVETKLAKYMLLNGCHLNKMTIYTSISEKEETCKEFLTFKRAMTCQLEFKEMRL